MSGRHPTRIPLLALAVALACASTFAPRGARAETYTFNLGSTAELDTASSTGIWNTASEGIQSAVAPDRSTATAATTSIDISFGDGSDGAFSDGPAQTGISISGNTITILSDTKSDV